MAGRILVIEDNSINLQLITYLLRAFNHKVLTASNSREGIAVAKKERVDLIICDVHLPGMDGYEVARYLKGHPLLRRVPLVAVTALAMVGDREKVLAAGFDYYISKPINPEVFIKKIEAYLNEECRDCDSSSVIREREG